MVSRPRRVVLVANHEPELYRLIEATLGSQDFEVLHAPDGLETLRITRERHPALVLLAVNIPEPNGFEVCRQVKADPTTAGIKVVMLTERSSEADRAQGREAGADDYFVKPFSPVELLNTIYALLE